MLYTLFKNFSKRVDPERIHDLSISVFHQFPSLAYFFNRENFEAKYQLSDNNMTWPFPIGLAAGFDKNALALNFLNQLGFGAIEVGTVTPKEQNGNAKPRIKRLSHEFSLLNKMGFPSKGCEFVKQELIKHKKLIPIGVNLGKNKDTSLQNSIQDYVYLYNNLASYADYIVVNISSPNTKDLRSLQNKSYFKNLCLELSETRKQTPRPIYLKLAPELESKTIKDLIELCKEFQFSGIIVNNTSIKHSHSFGGGLSGRLIREESRLARVRALNILKETPEISCIAVGGIEALDDIIDFWRHGGSFVQIYTSFVYQGPSILKKFKYDIDQLLISSGHDSLQEYLCELRNK